MKQTNKQKKRKENELKTNNIFYGITISMKQKPNKKQNKIIEIKLENINIYEYIMNGHSLMSRITSGTQHRIQIHFSDHIKYPFFFQICKWFIYNGVFV